MSDRIGPQLSDISKFMDELKRQQKSVGSAIAQLESEYEYVERQIQTLTENRTDLAGKLKHKKENLERINESVRNAETTYFKLLESSQTLVAFMKKEVAEMYQSLAEPEKYDPEKEIDNMANWMAEYLKLRAHYAWLSKRSLENNPIENASFADQFNDKTNEQGKFLRFMDAKEGSDKVTLEPIPGVYDELNATVSLVYVPNANFYNMSLSTDQSTVHVPTPIYKRKPDLLRKIDWSIIDKGFIGQKTETKDLSWQFFCSESGFMRYFPASSWVYDDEDADPKLDMFDCRTSEWYIDGATNAKNVIILLDMSGSMLGQKFEIAKQTIETIMETLSENDFFNVMIFSKWPEYLDPCFNDTLVQATLRNKKFVRNRLKTVSDLKDGIAGIAKYESALITAFEILQQLPIKPNWTTIEQVREFGAPSCDGFGKCFRTFTGDWVRLTREYLWAIENATDELGCNSAIMLITDGASDTHESIFKQWNAEHKIRFFSYLIGAEATEFREVKWMACYNYGFMVHISNLADVQEKVQHYIKVMSRPVGFYPEMVVEDDPVWTGVYMDRLFYTPDGSTLNQFLRKQGLNPESLKMVTTVAYPVVLNNSFMGVSGVAVPMIELQQMAPSFLLGTNAYSFLVDNNGYVMFHPQLRPLNKGVVKPNFNSMDILELEVPQDNALMRSDHFIKQIGLFAPQKFAGQSSKAGFFWLLREPQFSEDDLSKEKALLHNGSETTLSITLDYDSELRKYMVDGESSRTKDTITAKVVMGFEELTRVYKQHNTYHFRRIEGTLFSVGLAIPDEGSYRLRSLTPFKFEKINLDWLEDDTHWYLHPNWRYCLLNDTDWSLTPEKAFKVYLKQMKEMGGLPSLCRNYSRSALNERLLLDAQATEFLTNFWQTTLRLDKKFGIHLVFFATQSGLTRFLDGLLSDTIEYKDPYYEPPIGNETVVVKPEPSHLRATEEDFYQRSMRLPNRFVFDYNRDTNVFYKQETKSEYGRNENVSLLVTATKALFLGSAPIGVAGFEMLYDSLAHMVHENAPQCKKKQDGQARRKCYLLDEHGHVIYSSDPIDYAKTSQGFGEEKRTQLGEFYGKLKAPEKEIMAKMIKQKIFKEVVYTDYQAYCQRVEEKSAAARLLSPFYNLLKLLIWAGKELSVLFAEYSFWSVVSSLLTPAEAYTPFFHGTDMGYSCDKARRFYMLDWEQKEQSWRIDGYACMPDCKVQAVAAMVPHTNLLLIIQEATGPNCYSEKCKGTDIEATVFTEVNNGTDKNPGPFIDKDCSSTRARYRRAPQKCWTVDHKEMQELEKNLPCDGAISMTIINQFLLALSFLITLFLWSNN